jgi:hypothetical protein
MSELNPLTKRALDILNARIEKEGFDFLSDKGVRKSMALYGLYYDGSMAIEYRKPKESNHE